jgi:hypothetical protein
MHQRSLDGPEPDPRANPMAGNPLRTKDDVRRAVVDLVEPIVPHLSPGGARARLGSFGAAFAQRVAELEGYARPLWGIVPLVSGGGHFDHWDRWAAGLAAGTDPDGPEYWGPCAGHVDQRMVEMAAIGYALAATPEHIWDPLSGTERDRVVEWLRDIERYEPAPGNWLYFRLLVQMGLERVGVSIDLDARRRAVEQLDSYSIGDGWYSDGANGNIDYYIPFAFHTYGLVLAASGLGDRTAAERYIERARMFAHDFQHWFAPDGAAFAFGRSMTYRFAQGSFWGSLALADVDALPWEDVRGLALRHLRWWSERPISDRDGVLSVGYGYDNRLMGESYNSGGSPYWCMKAFTMLAAPDDHPFWTVDEAAPPAGRAVSTQPTAGVVVGRDESQVVALVAQRSTGFVFMEQGHAKYRKFAYSSRFGFSGDVESMFGTATTDSMLALLDAATGERRTRTAITLSEVADGAAFARWPPFPDVTVDTVLWGGAPWHLRVHRIVTGRALVAEETGFALPQEPAGLAFGPAPEPEPGRSVVASPWGVSTMLDLGDGSRSGLVRQLAVNTNMLWPHTAVPLLRGTLEPGTHLLACAVGASDRGAEVDPSTAPALPSDLLERLEAFASRPAPTVDPAADPTAGMAAFIERLRGSNP